MNKIVSNFYLIRLDGDPVYVGYTNRTIRQRFSEHKHDKDFGDVEPTVESLGKLEYDFTWDIGLINQYAKEVSDRETELVEQYRTQGSIWQKGVNGNIGGQTWADVKYFIKANRDSPVFKGMDGDIIMELLEWQEISDRKLRSMVTHTNIKGSQKLRDMIKDTHFKGSRRLRGTIENTNTKNSQKLRNMVYDTHISGDQKLRSMVKDTSIKGAKKLKNMVSSTKTNP